MVLKTNENWWELMVSKTVQNSDEKWWENGWFYHDSKTDGTPMAKWMVFPKLMGSLGKMDGFKSGPQTHEK